MAQASVVAMPHRDRLLQTQDSTRAKVQFSHSANDSLLNQQADAKGAETPSARSQFGGSLLQRIGWGSHAGLLSLAVLLLLAVGGLLWSTPGAEELNATPSVTADVEPRLPIEVVPAVSPMTHKVDPERPGTQAASHLADYLALQGMPSGSEIDELGSGRLQSVAPKLAALPQPQAQPVVNSRPSALPSRAEPTRVSQTQEWIEAHVVPAAVTPSAEFATAPDVVAADLVAAARNALRRGNPAAALTQLDAALRHEPGHEVAKQLRQQLRFILAEVPELKF